MGPAEFPSAFYYFGDTIKFIFVFAELSISLCF